MPLLCPPETVSNATLVDLVECRDRCELWMFPTDELAENGRKVLRALERGTRRKIPRDILVIYARDGGTDAVVKYATVDVRRYLRRAGIEDFRRVCAFLDEASQPTRRRRRGPSWNPRDRSTQLSRPGRVPGGRGIFDEPFRIDAACPLASTCAASG